MTVLITTVNQCCEVVMAFKRITLRRRLRRFTLTIVASIIILYTFFWYFGGFRTSDEHLWCNRGLTKQHYEILHMANLKEFQVITQNIYLPLLPFIGGKTNVEIRLETFAHGASNSDIVLVQELFLFKVGLWLRNDNYIRLGDLMAERGFVYQASSCDTVPLVFGQNSGLVIYSKHKILESKARVYAHRSINEWPSNKGYLMAKIALGQDIVYVVNTHLDSKKKLVRQRQLGTMLKEVKLEVDRDPGFVVVGGDLNSDGGEQEISIVQKETNIFGLMEVFTEHLATYHDGHTLDHLFVSDSLKVSDSNLRKFVTQNGGPVSDHYALWAHLKLK